MRDEAASAADTDHIDIVASAQELLEALGEVAQIAQEVRYVELLLELEILSALGEGIKQYDIATAAGKVPTTVRRWRDRAARFVMKLVTDARFTISSGDRLLVCECGQNFHLKSIDLFATRLIDRVATYLAIYRHWETHHGWDPKARDDTADNAANADLLSKRAIFEEPAHNEANADLLSKKTIPEEPRSGDAASGHVEVLIDASPGLLPETITVLEELAEDVDEKFSALGGSIRRTQRQSERLDKIAKSSEELTEQRRALKVATALARGLKARAKKSQKSVTGATIAKAAGVSPATVTRWADETDSLIRRISSGMLDTPDSALGQDGLDCSWCGERFTWSSIEDEPVAAIYRHWLMHHQTEQQSETPEQEIAKELTEQRWEG